MIYLATPYSHPDPLVREERFRAACRWTAAFMRAGEVVFSPIVHSHPLVECGLATGWSFWQRFDRAFLERCDEVVVLMLPGWRDSRGVQAEIGIAEALGLRVRYVVPDAPTPPTLARVAKEVRS